MFRPFLVVVFVGWLNEWAAKIGSWFYSGLSERLVTVGIRWVYADREGNV